MLTMRRTHRRFASAGAPAIQSPAPDGSRDRSDRVFGARLEDRALGPVGGGACGSVED